MGERLNGIQEVVGSIPIGSTKFLRRKNLEHWSIRQWNIGLKRQRGLQVIVFTFLAVYWVILAESRLLSELRIEEVAGFMLLPCLVPGGESTAYQNGATMGGRR